MFHPDDILVVAPLALIAFLHRWIARKGAFFLVLSNLPITVLHELAHFVVALLLGGNPTGFTLWPTRISGSWQLGKVTARGTLLSTAPTALAPLIWLFFGWMVLNERTELAGKSLSVFCIFYLAVYICIAASIPSWQDIKVAIMHPLSLLLWSAMLAAACYATGQFPMG